MPNDYPGIGDPYWFEWSVGLTYILELLNPESGIAGVTLQARDVDGLDDIVVRFRSGRHLCIQVKHTREADSLTFSDLVSATGAFPSLLRSVATAWSKARSAGMAPRAMVHTNRSVGRRASTARKSETKLPSLASFWEWLQQEAKTRESLDALVAPIGFADGWRLWREQLVELPDDAKLEFLRSLTLTTDSPSLKDTELAVVEQLERLLGCSNEHAHDLVASLDHALREWTTSDRPRDEIQADDVHKALCLRSDSVGTTHLVAPPAPFFPSREDIVTRVIDELCGSSSSVVFVTGPPGAGKTSIISRLSSQADRIVDIRFHAYRPITPDDSRLPPDADIDVSADGLWGALLSQLRDSLHGQLAKYRVPVRNGLLTASERRDHVLRIANELGEERGKAVTIAIDGIDHAVRANTEIANSFMDSIPSPDAVPSHVRILIGGQTPEAWPRYPAWLHHPSAKLCTIDVPPLQPEDVSKLLSATCTDQIAASDAASRLILDASLGQTLPTIFAIAEARLSSDVEELRQRLEARSLGSGLNSYYAEIWRALRHRLDGIRPFLAERTALTLALWDQRITGEMLSQAFADVPLPPSDWRSCLLELSPLVVEERDGFRPAHNDVRLFLMGQVNANPRRFDSHLSQLADFSLSAASNSKFTLGFQLLQRANRSAEIPQLFTADFVVEGWRSGLSISALERHATEALSEFRELRDWRLLMSVVVALRTLQQIDECTDWLGEVPTRSNAISPPPAALRSECLVVPKQEWSMAVIEKTLEEVLELADRGLGDRAHETFLRWFSDVSPPTLSRILTEVDENVFPATLEGTLRLFGRAAEAAGVRPPRVDRSTKDRTSWGHALAGYIDHALHSGSLRRWHRAFDTLGPYSSAWLDEHLAHLADEERWLEIAIALKKFRQRSSRFPSSIRLHLGVLALLVGSESLFDEQISSDQDPIFELVRDVSDESTRAESAVHAALITGYQTTRPFGGIRDDAVSAFRATHSRGSTVKHVAFLTTAAAAVGRWLKRRNEPCPLSADEFAEILQRLASSPVLFDLHSVRDGLSNRLFRLFVHAAGDASSRQIVLSVAREFLSTGRLGPAIEPIWSVALAHSDHDRLRTWLNARLSPDGDFWQQKTNERIDEIALLSALVTDLPEFARHAQTLARLGDELSFGYKDHKEYVLEHTLAWFRSCAERRPSIWRTHGLDLLSLSREADLAGDNRMALMVESIVGTAAALCGPSSLGDLEAALDGEHRWFEPHSVLWAGGIGEALQWMEVSEDDLFALWAHAIGCLSWQNDSDRAFLAEVRASIVAATNRLGLADFDKRIVGVSQLEWDVASQKPQTRLFDLWYHQPPARPKQDELAALFDSGDVAKLVKDFRKLVAEHSEQNDFKRAATQLAMRLRRERPHNHRDLARELLDVCLNLRRVPDWPWRYDGTQNVIEELAPLLADNDHWALIASVVDRIVEGSRLPTELCSDLETVCRCRSFDIEWLEFGLSLHLQAQKAWASTHRPFPRPTLPTSASFNTWLGYSIDGILRRLCSDSALLSHAALRALGALTQLVPGALDELIRRTPALPRDDAIAVGQVLEYLAFEKDALPTSAERLVDTWLSSGEIELELQAWAILSAKRRPGSELPESPQFAQSAGHSPSPSLLLKPGRLLIEDRGKDKAFHSTNDKQAAATVLRNLEAIGFPVQGLEGDLLSSLETSPLDLPAREELSRASDSAYQHSISKERLLELVRQRVPTSPPPELTSLLAQALLTSDEPRIMLGNWQLEADDAWPTAHELESLLRADPKELRRRLFDAMAYGLADGNEVVAATLTSFSDTHIAIAHRAPLCQKPDIVLKPHPNPTTLGGRAVVLGSAGRLENRADEDFWLWLRTGGLGRFPWQNLGIVPAAELQRRGILRPAPHDPFLWITRSGLEIRYERIYARSEVSRAFHIPVVERWVGATEVLSVLDDECGSVIRLLDNFQVFPIH